MIVARVHHKRVQLLEGAWRITIKAGETVILRMLDQAGAIIERIKAVNAAEGLLALATRTLSLYASATAAHMVFQLVFGQGSATR